MYSAPMYPDVCVHQGEAPRSRPGQLLSVGDPMHGHTVGAEVPTQVPFLLTHFTLLYLPASGLFWKDKARVQPPPPKHSTCTLVSAQKAWAAAWPHSVTLQQWQFCQGLCWLPDNAAFL